jgi:hypothetical protein
MASLFLKKISKCKNAIFMTDTNFVSRMTNIITASVDDITEFDGTPVVLVGLG